MTRAEVEGLEAVEGVIHDAVTYQEKTKAWQDAFRLYEDVVHHGSVRGVARTGGEYDRLFALANEAFGALGGMPELRDVSLGDYDAKKYGPFLGVSDEGGVAERIRDALLHSPKVLAAGKIEPLVVGGAVDAERLGGAGETPTGPDEYRKIQMACTGRILTTTNVGTRQNVRYYHNQPLVVIRDSDRMAAARSAVAMSKKLLFPFFRTPDGKPRPVAVFVLFVKSVPKSVRLAVLRHLAQEMRSGSFCDPSVHRLGLLVSVEAGKKGSVAVRDALALASRVEIDQVAVEGVVRKAAYESISLPGLLNFFDKETTNMILSDAQRRRIVVRPWEQVDVDTVARSTWAPLQVARRMGLYLGKYGLLPLTIQEGDYVVGKLQSWFPDWSAAPAIYIDTPVVTPHRVFSGVDAVEGVKHWLNLLREHGVKVTLIDTAEKAKGRCMLKQDEKDPVGILTLEEVIMLNDYAVNLGIKALWAGGISTLQAHEFGKLGVFGIYVTSATTRKVEVSGDYVHDPSLPNEREPTYRGVLRVKLLLEAGFVERRFRGIGEGESAVQTAETAEDLIRHLAEDPKGDYPSLEEELAHVLVKGWRRLLGTGANRGDDG
jgi:hypothetical protein